MPQNIFSVQRGDICPPISVEGEKNNDEAASGSRLICLLTVELRDETAIFQLF